MKISIEESARAAQLTPVVPVAGSQSQAEQDAVAAPQTDTPAATATFSTQAQDISRAKAAVAAAPDVREDLVASIKQQVDSGTYKVSSSDIAEMMMRRSEADNIS